MKITGRHMDVTPALKRYIRARFERLERYDVSPDRLEIVLSVTKLQHTAEVVCSIRGKRFQAKTSTREMYATVDQLVELLLRQLLVALDEHFFRARINNVVCGNIPNHLFNRNGDLLYPRSFHLFEQSAGKFAPFFNNKVIRYRMTHIFTCPDAYQLFRLEYFGNRSSPLE